jgi:site-specific recombinase XerD
LTPFNNLFEGKESAVNYAVNNRIVLSLVPQGPIAAYLDSFSNSLVVQGYQPHYIHQQVWLAACFSQWLKQTSIRLRRISSAHAELYLQYRYRHLRPRRGDAAGLRSLIDFLRLQGAIAAQKVAVRRLTPVERCANAYEEYLREARALARATIINYVPFIHDFLRDCFGSEEVKLSCLDAGDVVRFVQRQAPRLHMKRAKLMTCALRSFLNYARYCGDVTLDLAAAVPVVPNWSMTSIPRAIASDKVRELLASIDRHTAMGRRDYAILLLLARLGLRSGEVAFLNLDDIDWNTGRLSVCGKSGQRSDLPLSAEVGKAIAAYLKRGRPQSTSRRVFLRAKAPNDGFQSACGVGSIVQHSLGRAGIQAPTKGAHQFRHGLACEMLRRGASLSEIGQLLGHHNPQTTKIYAKVDVKALRTLAVPWPRGVR